jgi:hypothetical protein
LEALFRVLRKIWIWQSTNTTKKKKLRTEIKVNRNIQISTDSVGSFYAIFDMQGRVLKKGRVERSNFSIVVPRKGSYFVKVGKQIERINVK